MLILSFSNSHAPKTFQIGLQVGRSVGSSNHVTRPLKVTDQPTDLPTSFESFEIENYKKR